MGVVTRAALKTYFQNNMGTGLNTPGPTLETGLVDLCDSVIFQLTGIVDLMSNERTSAATLTISNLKTNYIGSTNATWTLPAGATAIQGVDYYFDHIGTSGLVTINRAGADTINGSDTSIILYPTGRLIGYWDGVTWVIK